MKVSRNITYQIPTLSYRSGPYFVQHLLAKMPGTLLSRRDVDTSLNFWKAAAEPVNLDFTQPGAETRFKALGSLNEPAKLTVQDARGQEDEFNLERNGFVYAKHKIEGLEALTSEEEIEKAVIPETENLVKRL